MFYIFPRAISKKECEKLLDYCIKNTELKEASILKKEQSDTASDRHGLLDPRIRKTDIAFVEPDCKEGNQVNELAWEFLNEANKRQFNYKIDSFQPVQFARYRDGGHYNWHRDVNEYALTPNGESRKLSLTFALTDPKDYEGGELQFFTGERPEEQRIINDIRDQGTVIVFDSRDYHRVTPVTKGTRYSIVCWSVGPNLV